MKRVLMTASTLGHFMNFHKPYIQAFQQDGWQVDLGCPFPGGEPPLDDVGVINLPFVKKMSSLKNLAVTAQIRGIVSQYDLVVCHTTLASFFTRLALLGMSERPRVVSVAHGYLMTAHGSSAKNGVLLRAERAVAGVTDLVLTMNQWDYQLAKREKLGRDVQLIPGMGVPLMGSGTAVDLHQALGLPATAFVLGYGGEYSKRKNQSFLIKAMKSLPDHVYLVLWGRGACQGKYQALADKLGVSNRVIFAGHVPALSSWYQGCQAVVSSSVSEGLPFHVMEAMMAGVPVILSKVKGHEDLVNHGGSGLLYPLNDEKEFCQQVMALYGDYNLGKKLARKARENSEWYTLDVVLPNVMDLYLNKVTAKV